MEASLSDLICKLNQSIYEMGSESVQKWIDDEGIALFEYHSSGWADAIDFLGEQIWSSEDDQRKYLGEELDEYESMEPFLRRKANEILAILTQLTI